MENKEKTIINNNINLFQLIIETEIKNFLDEKIKLVLIQDNMEKLFFLLKWGVLNRKDIYQKIKKFYNVVIYELLNTIPNINIQSLQIPNIENINIDVLVNLKLVPKKIYSLPEKKQKTMAIFELTNYAKKLLNWDQEKELKELNINESWNNITVPELKKLKKEIIEHKIMIKNFNLFNVVYTL